MSAALMACSMGLLSPRPLLGQEMEVPVPLQTELFLKVMTFDRNLGERTKNETVLVVVYQGGNKISTRAQEDFTRTVERLRRTWRGSVLRVVAIDLDQEELSEALKGLNATAMYVTPLRAVDIGNVAGIARGAKISTFTGVPQYISEGLAVGVRVKRDRPKLLVNVSASRLEGADYSSELLKMAEVVK
jgi:hypothetical protein